MGIEIARSGGIVTVAIDRPQASNAVDPDTALALWRAFVEFERDEQMSVAVLTGNGRAFCAGFDLGALAGGEPAGWLQQLHFGDDPQEPPLGPMGPTRLQLSKPVIAAVNGPAVAGGMELALWCDLRIMEEQAYMGVYCRRWGVPLIDGGTVRLPRLVGHGRASELILTGRRVDAAECDRIGLCERIVPSGESRASAERLAEEIARFPQHCMLADRASLTYQQGRPLREALEAEFQGGLPVVATEGIAGARRFAAGYGRHGNFDDI